MINKSLSNGIRQVIFERDARICQYCGKKEPEVKLTIDHIYPVIKGGTNEATNLITACTKCNRDKKDKILKNPPTVKDINLKKLPSLRVTIRLDKRTFVDLKVNAIENGLTVQEILEKAVMDYLRGKTTA
jgi:5-methylcytosine-specific restriction endonuclease McrA